MQTGADVEARARPEAAQGSLVGQRRPSARTLPRPLLLLLPLIVLCIVFTSLNSSFLSKSNLESILNQNAVLAMAAVGETIVVLAGGIDLSIEGVMAVSSIVCALLVANNANSVDLGFLGIAIGCAAGTLFGLVNGLLNTYGKVPSFAGSLGLWYVGLGLEALIAIHFSPAGVNITSAGVNALVVENKAGLSWLTLMAIGAVLAGYLVQRFTTFGRRLVAVGINQSLAGSAGIRVRRIKIAAFACAGTLFGVAGFMSVTQYGGISSNVSSTSGQTLFAVITALVIGGTALSGGKGGFLYSGLGILTLGALNDGMVLSGVPAFYQELVSGGLIIVALSVGAWHTTRKYREIVK
jgi:ribose transport system permease protein